MLSSLLLTTAVLHFGGVGNFWIALSLMAVLCFAFRELATVHYGIESQVHWLHRPRGRVLIPGFPLSSQPACVRGLSGLS